MLEAKQAAYLLRLREDRDNFVLGTLDSNGRFRGWALLFIDAISDCFGNEAYEQAKKMTAGELRRVVISLEIQP